MRTKWAALVLAAAMCVGCTACGGGTSGSEDDASSDVSTQAVSADDMFTERDFEIGYDNDVTVTLADSGSSADGSGVSIDGGTVTITQAGTYLLTGTLSEGQIVVEIADTEKVQIVLDNASITNSSSAAIYVKQADKVFLTMAEGSENALSVTGDYVQTDDNNIDAVIFSKEDVTMNGLGTLTIDAAYGHGVVSKDDLVFTSGTYNITAASHGLSGKDSVRIAAGTFSITSGKDGIHAENADDTTLGFVYIADGDFTIAADTDGISASTTLAIADGTFDLTTGGGSANASTQTDGQTNGNWGQWGTDVAPGAMGAAPDDRTAPTGASGMQAAPGTAADGAAANDTAAEPSANNGMDTATADSASTETTSAKGLKSGSGMEISSGTMTVDSSDDSMHTNGDMTISGGTITLTSGDDGIHADAQLIISGGTVAVDKSYEGLEGAEIQISDGTISVIASDDGLNAAGGNDGSSTDGRMGQNEFEANSSASITISGGNLTVDAGGDGIDSNGDLTVTGGIIFVNGPTNGGNGALDYGGNAEISGGIFAAVGAVGMEQNFSGGTQGCILYNLSASQSAGSAITLTDSDGIQLASFASAKPFQSIVISAPGVESGGTYTLTAGSETISIEMTDTLYSNSTGMGVQNGGQRAGNFDPRANAAAPADTAVTMTTPS